MQRLFTFRGPSVVAVEGVVLKQGTDEAVLSSGALFETDLMKGPVLISAVDGAWPVRVLVIQHREVRLGGKGRHLSVRRAGDDVQIQASG